MPGFVHGSVILFEFRCAGKRFQPASHQGPGLAAFALALAAWFWQEHPDKENKGEQAMKPRNHQGRCGPATSINHSFDCCALHVVVYRAPGPDDGEIQSHALSTVARHSTCRTREGLGYLTLTEPDFDRVRQGVERGDALGTAYAVLMLLGPGAKQFVGRENDFIFGWVGATDESWGDLLVLEVFPRPHLLTGRN